MPVVIRPVLLTNEAPGSCPPRSRPRYRALSYWRITCVISIPRDVRPTLFRFLHHAQYIVKGIGAPSFRAVSQPIPRRDSQPMPKHGAIYPTTNSLSIRRGASYPSYPSKFGGPPSARERREAAAHPSGGGRTPQSSSPRRREGGDWVPAPAYARAGSARERRTHPHRHSRDGGRAAMGSRLRGNDGRHPHRHSRDGGRAAMGSRLRGNDGGHPHRHSREGGNPRRRGPGDGSPSPRGRRWASTSSFPRRRESTAAGGAGGGMGPRLHGDDGGHPHRHSRDTTGGRRWVPACAGTTVIQRSVSTGTGFPPARERRLYNGGRSSCPWRGSGGTLCCRPTS